MIAVMRLSVMSSMVAIMTILMKSVKTVTTQNDFPRKSYQIVHENLRTVWRTKQVGVGVGRSPKNSLVLSEPRNPRSKELRNQRKYKPRNAEGSAVLHSIVVVYLKAR